MGGNTSAEEIPDSRGSSFVGGTDLREVFNKIDANKNGKLDKGEIRKALESINTSDQEIKEKLKCMGSRKSVDYEEFKSICHGIQLQKESKKGSKELTVASKADDGPAPKAKAGKAKGKGEGGKEPMTDKGKGKGKGKGEKPSGPFGGGKGFRLNVKNLAGHIDDQMLQEMFKPYGKVLQCEVKKNGKKKHTAYGFVTLSSEAEGRKAIAGLDGVELNKKKIAVGPAERRHNTTEDEELQAYQEEYAAALQFYQQQQQYYQLAQIAQYQQMYYAQAQQQQESYRRHSIAALAQQIEESIYEGSLKSISKKGYGFIVCKDTYAIWQRDVYIDKRFLPAGIKVNDRVVFTVQQGEQGHPQATSCEFALA